MSEPISELKEKTTSPLQADTAAVPVPVTPKAPEEDNPQVTQGEQRSEMHGNLTTKVVLLFIAVALIIGCAVASGLTVYSLAIHGLDELAALRGEAKLAQLKASFDTAFTSALQEEEELVAAFEMFMPQYDFTSFSSMMPTFNETFFNYYIPKGAKCRSQSKAQHLGSNIRVLFPLVTNASIVNTPQRNTTGCYGGYCRGPGEPTFQAAFVSYWRESAKSNNGTTNCVWAASTAVNAVTAFKIQPGTGRRTDTAFWTLDLTSLSTNGSSTYGYWTAPAVFQTVSGHMFFYGSYKRQYYFPHPTLPGTWVPVITTAYVSYDDLHEKVLATRTGDDSILLTYDSKLRILTNSLVTREAGSDPRLRNCYWDFANSSTTVCGAMSALTIPIPFISDLFNAHQYDLQNTVDGDWNYKDKRTGEVWHLTKRMTFQQPGAEFYVIGLWGSKRSVIRQSIGAPAVAAISVSTVVVVVISSILAFMGFYLLHDSERVTQVATEISQHLATYDTGSAQQVLQQEGSHTPLYARLQDILVNLEHYRPFLPGAFLRKQKITVPRTKPSPIGLSVNDRMATSFSSRQQLIFQSPYHFESRKVSLVLITCQNFNGADLHIAEVVTKAFVETVLSIADDACVVEELTPARILISFNAHFTVFQHEELACAAALLANHQLQNMQSGEGASFKKLNLSTAVFDEEQLRLLLSCLRFSITVASGPCFVGTCGSHSQRSTFVYGETYDLLMKCNKAQAQLSCGVAIANVSDVDNVGSKQLCMPLSVIQTVLYRVEVFDPSEGHMPLQHQFSVRTTTVEKDVEILQLLWFENAWCPQICSAVNLQRHGHAAEAATQLGELSIEIDGACIHENNEESLEKCFETLSAREVSYQVRRLANAAKTSSKLSTSASSVTKNGTSRKEQFFEVFEGEVPFESIKHDVRRGNSAGSTTAAHFHNTHFSHDGVHSAYLRRVLLRGQKGLKFFDELDFDEEGSPSFKEGQDSVATWGEEDEGLFSVATFGEKPVEPVNLGSLSIHPSNELPPEIVDHDGRKWTRIGERIGKGAQFNVFRGVEKRSGKQCAIKSVRSETAASLDATKLRDETLAYAKLHHPNIVAYITYAKGPGYFCILEEYVAGGDLVPFLNSAGPLPGSMILMIMGELINALDYIHSHSIVHCDLKPANILVSTTSDSSISIKIADFGHAIQIAQAPVGGKTASAVVSSGSSGSTDSDHAETRHLRGSPCYSAPEVLKDEFTPMGDIWSLGILLFEMLAGENPWLNTMASKRMEFMAMLKAGTRPDKQALKEVRSRNWAGSITTDDALGPLWDIADQCCTLEPTKRPTLKQITEAWKLTSERLDPQQEG